MSVDERRFGLLSECRQKEAPCFAYSPLHPLTVPRSMGKKCEGEGASSFEGLDHSYSPPLVIVTVLLQYGYSL